VKNDIALPIVDFGIAPLVLDKTLCQNSLLGLSSSDLFMFIFYNDDHFFKNHVRIYPISFSTTGSMINLLHYSTYTNKKLYKVCISAH